MRRGVEVDIGTQIISISGSCLWTGVATLLSRSPLVQQSGSVLSEARQQQEQESPEFQGKNNKQNKNICKGYAI